MKSSSPKNLSSTSEEPKFSVGDLVSYIYQTSTEIYPEVGLVLEVHKVDLILPEESSFAEILYEYDILWTGRNYTSIIFEMFIEKYEYQK
tara:strand:- start:5 stop:274 length:270 start_codon:yes stop_codon:yes gene_type:complete